MYFAGFKVFFVLFFALSLCYYLRVQILADLKIVDLAGINFGDFAITCSIYSKMCGEFDISG